MRTAAAAAPGRIGCFIGYDEALAHLIQGGADALLVPSRFEPCGLTQRYAMRYGAVPVVTAVGGLRDTVAPLDVTRAMGTGIRASAPDETSLLLALEQALGTFRDRIAMNSLIARAMARDSSWTESTTQYLSLYDALRVAP